MALALLLGTFTAVLGALAISAVTATPASASPAPGVDVAENCSASAEGTTQSASSDRQMAAVSSPASVNPGGAFTLTYSDSGNNAVPLNEPPEVVAEQFAQTIKIDTPANATVTSGPTITQQGYFYNPATPTNQTALPGTVALSADAHSPSGQIITLSIPGNIPGGDNWVQPTFTIGLTASSNPSSNQLSSGMLDVQPVGTGASSDPGDAFSVTVNNAPVVGTVTAVTSCWPFPSPQPPYVTTGIIDNVPPVITIASPGDSSQVVQNAHVVAAYGCVDPPIYGNGIASCTATLDGQPLAVGQAVNTTDLGPHTVVVSSTNNSGFSSQKTSNYVVIAPPYNLVPPTVTITSPTNGAQYITGSPLTASFTCSANAPATLSSCTGDVPNGSAISTTAGYHTFTVTAKDSRGNPTSQTIGYYARTSNTSTTTTPGDVAVTATNSGSNNYNCSWGTQFDSNFSEIIDTLKSCSNSGTGTPEATWSVTAPAGNNGQLAVGDQINVKQQIFRPGAQASASNGGYYSGPYQSNLTVNAPANTVINGPITTSTTGLPSSTYGVTGSPQGASACNFGATGAVGTGVCTGTSGNVAATTSTASGATTVAAAGSTTVANPGSTTVGAYGSTTVNTLYSNTVAAGSNGQSITALTGSSLSVASISGAPTASGNRLEVTTSLGTELVSYTGTATGKFNGIAAISGPGGTVATGAVVREPLSVSNMVNLPVAATTGFRTSGTNQVTVATDSGTATLQYTSTATTTAACGTQPCLLGVTLVSGSGNIAKTNAVFQAPFAGTGILPAATTGFPTAGTLNVTLGGNPAVVNYTALGTTTAVCGTAACFTGVTLVSGSGTAAAGSAITQVKPDISTFQGAGVLSSASVTGFPTSGSVTAATSNGTDTFTYTGTSTTVGTCGSAACFTGVTIQGPDTGSLTGGGAITQIRPDISTFAGAGVIPSAGVSGFTTSGSINAATSGGSVTFTYTGTSTAAGTCGSAACFTGVTTQGGASGSLTPGGAITQNLPNVTTLSGASLSVTASTGFLAPGLVALAVSGGTAYLSFTGTGTGTLTGVTYQGGATGTATPAGSVVQADGLSNGNTAWNQVASSSSGVNVTSFIGGGGTLNLNSATADPWTAPATVQVVTSTGVVTLSYTGISGNTLTGVSAPAGASGLIFTDALAAEPTATSIAGATTVNGTPVSGYNWSVPATNQTSFNVAWNGSSCENSAGAPAPTGTAACASHPSELSGIDGAYVFLRYTLTVTSPGTITMPGLPAVSASTANFNNPEGILATKVEWGSNPFITNAIAAPGVTWSSVDPNPPTATLSTPTQGAVYAFGQTVDANFACSDPSGGITITSCTGIEDAGTSFQHSVANGAALNTTALVPNEIHTFTVTATNSEGYTDSSYATFTALADPPSLVDQTVNAPVGQTTAIPFNYSGDYPANLSTEQIVTPPAHGTVAVQPDGSFQYTNDNTTNTTDSFQFDVSDTASNPSNVETVNINLTDTNSPMISVTNPLPDGTSAYAYQSTSNAAYSCSDLVLGGITSCTASQDVNGVQTDVPNGSPLDTSSLIVGNTHSLTITAVNFFGLMTTKTVNYTVNTPAPVTNNDTAHTINPVPVNIPVLNNDTTNFPFDPSTVTVIGAPTFGTTAVEPNGSILYTPTTASTSSVTTDHFTYTVKDTDGQVSNASTVTVTIFPIPGVTGISPIAGPLSQGAPVVITGTGFATATAVTFGTTPASSFHIDSNTQITAVAPAAPGGVPSIEDITVTAPGGTSATGTADQYSWDPVPTLSSISPHEGVAAGGATITVHGSGFASGQEGATVVVVREQDQSSPCTVATVSPDGTSLTCTTGSSSVAGIGDVIVSTPGGTTTAIPADQFTYFFPAPSITSVSPTDGSPAGGTAVTITGNSFSGATSVSFGVNPATSFTVNSNTSITATAPAGTAGSRVDITVTGPGGTSSTLPADQFTYGPQVTRVAPATGSPAGGTSVVITGAGLTGATAINFGSTPATSFTVNSATSVTAVTPAGSGSVNVTVTTPAGTSPISSSDTFVYTSPVPSVSSVSPASGSTAGGNTVTLGGNGFTGATTVSFGGNPATGITVLSSTVITAVAPAGSAGTVDVTVTTPGGTSAANPNDHYTYGSAVTSVSPHTGSTAGGTVVTVTGNGFTGSTAVDFGSTPGTSLVVNSNTSVTVTSPAGAVGTVDVRVVTPSGTSPVVGGDAFTYSTSLPTVASISPTSGPTAGGTTVTITGNGLTGATAVAFGGVAATGVTVNGAGTTVTAISPAGSAGSTVAVTVTTPAGTSASVANGQFTYGATVGHLSPNSGLITGGTLLTITGTGFTGASAVNFGTTPGANLVINSATSISVKSPVHAVGPVDVTVVVGGVASPTSPADVFTFQYPVPVIGSMTPNVGTPGGGDTVTITGSGFTGATTVSFGANPATIVTNTGTQLTVTTPAGTAKAVVDVTVTGPGGTSALNSSDKFTYGPVVTSLSPNTGSHLGGTLVTVKGAGFTGATAVNFGGVAVTSGITVNATGTSLTVHAPAGAAGAVNVTVAAGGNTSNTGSVDTYTYV
jgi:hypothetical protein